MALTNHKGLNAPEETPPGDEAGVATRQSGQDDNNARPSPMLEQYLEINSANTDRLLF